MNFLLMGLTSLIFIHSQLSLASEKSCNDILTKSLNLSLTDDFWSYLKELSQNKTLSNDQIQFFYTSLTEGKLINPIPHQMTNIGPVFKNSNDLIHYKRITQYLDASQSLDLNIIKSRLEFEFENLKSISLQKVNVVQESNKNLIKDKFIEIVSSEPVGRFKFYHDLFKKLSFDIFKDKHKEVTQITLDLLQSNINFKKEYAFELLQKTNQLEPNFDLYKYDIKLFLDTINNLEIENLKDPIKFTKQFIAIINEIKSNDNIFVRMTLFENYRKIFKLLNVDQSEIITNYFKELLHSPNEMVKFYAHFYYIQRSSTDGLELAKKIFKEYPREEQFLTYIAAALSYYKSDEAVQLMHQIFDDKNIGFNIKENLFYGFDENSTPQQFELIKKAINVSNPGVNYPIKSALHALSLCKGPEAFSMIKSLVLSSKDQKTFNYFSLLMNRPEKEVYEIALSQITTNQNNKFEAFQAIGQLHYPEIRDAIFNLAIESKNFSGYLKYTFEGMKTHDIDFLIPILNYYKDKNEIEYGVFEILLKGRTDETTLAFTKKHLSNDEERTVNQALKNLEVFNDSIKMPIIHDFISKTKFTQSKSYALKMLYGKLDKKSIDILSEALKSKDYELVASALPGYLYAIFIGNIESLNNNSSVKLGLDSMAILQKY